MVFYHLALRPQKPQMDQVAQMAQLNPGGTQVRPRWGPGGPGETFHWSEIMFAGNADDDVGDVESYEK